jgi:hypothetical protein
VKARSSSLRCRAALAAAVLLTLLALPLAAPAAAGSRPASSGLPPAPVDKQIAHFDLHGLATPATSGDSLSSIRKGDAA